MTCLSYLSMINKLYICHSAICFFSWIVVIVYLPVWDVLRNHILLVGNVEHSLLCYTNFFHDKYNVTYVYRREMSFKITVRGRRGSFFTHECLEGWLGRVLGEWVWHFTWEWFGHWPLFLQVTHPSTFFLFVYIYQFLHDMQSTFYEFLTIMYFVNVCSFR